MTLTNSDGSATNLTGFNFSFNIATLCGNIAALQVLNTGSAPGITTTNNVITIVIPSATMSTLTGNEFIYQFKMIGTDEAQTTTTLLRGKIILLTEVGNG
jgi:hypothetical protein